MGGSIILKFKMDGMKLLLFTFGALLLSIPVNGEPKATMDVVLDVLVHVQSEMSRLMKEAVQLSHDAKIKAQNEIHEWEERIKNAGVDKKTKETIMKSAMEKIQRDLDTRKKKQALDNFKKVTDAIQSEASRIKPHIDMIINEISTHIEAIEECLPQSIMNMIIDQVIKGAINTIRQVIEGTYGKSWISKKVADILYLAIDLKMNSDMFAATNNENFICSDDVPSLQTDIKEIYNSLFSISKLISSLIKESFNIELNPFLFLENNNVCNII